MVRIQGLQRIETPTYVGTADISPLFRLQNMEAGVARQDNEMALQEMGQGIQNRQRIENIDLQNRQQLEQTLFSESIKFAEYKQREQESIREATAVSHATAFEVEGIKAVEQIKQENRGTPDKIPELTTKRLSQLATDMSTKMDVGLRESFLGKANIVSRQLIVGSAQDAETIKLDNYATLSDSNYSTAVTTASGLPMTSDGVKKVGLVIEEVSAKQKTADTVMLGAKTADARERAYKGSAWSSFVENNLADSPLQTRDFLKDKDIQKMLVGTTNITEAKIQDWISMTNSALKDKQDRVFTQIEYKMLDSVSRIIGTKPGTVERTEVLQQVQRSQILALNEWMKYGGSAEDFNKRVLTPAKSFVDNMITFGDTAAKTQQTATKNLYEKTLASLTNAKMDTSEDKVFKVGSLLDTYYKIKTAHSTGRLSVPEYESLIKAADSQLSEAMVGLEGRKVGARGRGYATDLDYVLGESKKCADGLGGSEGVAAEKRLDLVLKMYPMVEEERKRQGVQWLDKKYLDEIYDKAMKKVFPKKEEVDKAKRGSLYFDAQGRLFMKTETGLVYYGA